MSVASSSGATQRARRSHDAETRMWQAEQKLVDAQCKLTQSNLELQRLRAGAEQSGNELLYVRRLYEREQREKAALDAEVHSLRQQLKRQQQQLGAGSVNGNGEGDGGGGAEREALLKAQLEDATERSRAHITEAERLREEVERLRGCLADHREPGQIRHELSHVRDERVRLALELHEAKQHAISSQVQAAHANEQVAAVDALRASTNEANALLAESRAQVTQLHEERSAMAAEHNEVLGKAQQLAQELDAVRHEHGQLHEQKLALTERLNATEHSVSALRQELRQREDDFQVDLGLFAARDEESRAAIDKHQAEARRGAQRCEELEAALHNAVGQHSQLAQEVEALRRANEQTAGVALRAEEERGQASARAEVTEIELRRQSLSAADKAERSDAKTLLLSQRLEQTLRELQATIHERDRLAATLEEALTRCTSSLVARQLAEDDCKAALRQLDAMRTLQAVH